MGEVERTGHAQRPVADTTDGEAAAPPSMARRRRDLVDAARLRLLARAPGLSIQAFLTATLDEAEALTRSDIGFFHLAEGADLELQA